MRHTIPNLGQSNNTLGGHFTAMASAEINAELVCPLGTPSFSPGVHNYDPKRHELVEGVSKCMIPWAVLMQMYGTLGGSNAPCLDQGPLLNLWIVLLTRYDWFPGMVGWYTPPSSFWKTSAAILLVIRIVLSWGWMSCKAVSLAIVFKISW